MSDKPWKHAERQAAALIGGTRYWANAGQAIDCESADVVAQVKHRQRASLAELEGLALIVEQQGHARSKAGVVLVKRRAGSGRATPWLVIMTAAVYRAIRQPSPRPGDERSRVMLTYDVLGPIEIDPDRPLGDPPMATTPSRLRPRIAERIAACLSQLDAIGGPPRQPRTTMLRATGHRLAVRWIGATGQVQESRVQGALCVDDPDIGGLGIGTVTWRDLDDQAHRLRVRKTSPGPVPLVSQFHPSPPGEPAGLTVVVRGRALRDRGTNSGR